ncbi:MAG: hypothetical protein WA140_06460 [Geobacteraceae bacterium]
MKQSKIVGKAYYQDGDGQEQKTHQRQTLYGTLLFHDLTECKDIFGFSEKCMRVEGEGQNAESS